MTNVLLYSDLNTNYLYMQMAGHSYSHSRSCDKCSHTFLILTYFHIQIKELRRPGTWLIFVSTSFILILYSRKTGNEEHPLESYLVFIIFAAALYWKLAAYYIWQFKTRVLNLYYQEYITERVCNSHMVSIPTIWIGRLGNQQWIC